MKLRFSTLLAALTVTALAMPAQSADRVFRAKNSMKVADRSNLLIEVGGLTGVAGFEDYWCAVGDYLHRVKRTDWDRKVYVVRGLGPAQAVNSRDSVLFSLDPVAAGVTPLDKGPRVVGTLTVGRSKSVNSAFYSCQRFPTNFRD